VSFRVEKIISGGQTGVDRAALDVAISLGIACGGWCPLGRRAEDGRISERYPLQEMARPAYADRTVQNVAESDGTLILTVGKIAGGTLLTKKTAQKRHKPYLVLDLEQIPEVADIWEWIHEHTIRVLNVAGPRASQSPRAYGLATGLLLRLLSSPRAEKRKSRSAT
jgi:hypothetical protein